MRFSLSLLTSAPTGYPIQIAFLFPLIAFFLGVVVSSSAYEISFAETGYKPTSGMEYAIHYEIKKLIARNEQLFQRKAPEKFEIHYRIFLTRAEFEAYTSTTNKTASKNVLGYTRPAKRVSTKTGEITSVKAEVVTWKHDQPAQHHAVVLHETTHAVMHAFLRRIPLWMNEGSADWFGQPQWANSDIQKNERARRWQILKDQLDKGKLPPLQDYLVTETYEEWDKMFNGNRARGYTIGYSLFDFFMSTPNSQAFLATLLKQPDVETGGKASTMLTARIAKLWRGGLPALERGWHEWIRRKAEQEKYTPPKK